jgi:hypothetical protein
VQSKEFRPGVSSFAVATSTTSSHWGWVMQESPDIGIYKVSIVDVDAMSLLACFCKTQQRTLALTYYEGTRDINREI